MRNNETASTYLTTGEIISRNINLIYAKLAAPRNRYLRVSKKLDIEGLILDGLISKKEQAKPFPEANPRKIGRVIKKDGALLEKLQARLGTIAEQAEQHFHHNRPLEALDIPIGIVTAIGGEEYNIVSVIAADQLVASPKPVAIDYDQVDRFTTYEYRYYRTLFGGIYVEETICVDGNLNIKREYSLVGENYLPPI